MRARAALWPQEFSVFMWLLKGVKKGQALPALLTPGQLATYAGYSVAGSPSPSLDPAGANPEKAMQEQAIAELVALGFDEPKARVGVRRMLTDRCTDGRMELAGGRIGGLRQTDRQADRQKHSGTTGCSPTAGQGAFLD
jgi:hypothetical protein